MSYSKILKDKYRSMKNVLFITAFRQWKSHIKRDTM